jgi:hypothetical protein
MTKAIFISYNQALNDRVMEVLDRQNARGFTKWDLTLGRGSVDGEPHYATHAWPAMNSSILTVVKSSQVESILGALREIDLSAPQHGLRAFVWAVEESI